MKIKAITAASTLALALAFGSPALAQSAGNGTLNAGNQANGNQDNDQDNDTANADNDQTNGNSIANDFLDLLSNNANGSDRDNVASSILGSDVNYGNQVTAIQTLSAVNSNSQLDEVVDMDGEDGSETPVGYNSGSNSVSGNAFAAFAGISNNAWNTGINNNTQAATNIAAQGTVNFGVTAQNGGAGGGAPGGPGGD